MFKTITTLNNQQRRVETEIFKHYMLLHINHMFESRSDVIKIYAQ